MLDNDDDDRPVNQEDGNNLNGREDGTNYNSHRAASAGNDHGMATTMTTNYINNRHHDDNCFYKQKKSQQRPDVNVQSEEEAMACCCHPEGLCGGDNNVVVNLSSKLRLLSIDNNNNSTTSATAADDNVKQLNIPAAANKPFTSNADELKNKMGIVACNDSSDNTTHHDENKDDKTNNNTTTLSMKTMSTSIEEYDTFNRNANMMPLGEEEAEYHCNNNDSWYHNLAGDGDGNNHHFNQQQQSNYNHISPTPIMSFDYSSYYEPSTPEHKTLLFPSGREKEVVSKNSSVGTNGKKRNISMPNLFATPENHHSAAAAVNHLPLQQQTVTVKSSYNDPIRNSTIAQSKKTEPSSSSLQNQQQSSSTTNCNNNNNAMPLSSVPTFLNHLSQVTITRISAHPQGQHVLLVSNEGMLFSFGSNEHGQLGTGRNSRQHQQKQQQQLTQYNDNDAYYVKEPTLITPLLENGGKTVHCAAGVDYSLVVVRTERSRIMNANKNRRRQQQQQQQFSSFQKKNAASSSSNNNTTTSTDTSTSSSSPTSASLKEFKTAHEQMYAFGCNDNNKLGLLDPEKKQTMTNGYESSTRRRRRKNRDSTDSNTSHNIHSPEPAELISSPSSTGLLDSPDSFASMASTDVYLPRRTALHCEVILKNDGSDYHHHAQQQILHNHNTKVANSTTATLSSLPYGIVSVAAAKHHSAAVVKRPCGSVELYTWGRGEDGQLGLFTPPDNNSSTVDASSSPRRGWESLCCTSMEHNTDASTLNSLIDEDVSLGEGGVTKTQSHASIATPHYVGRPTLVPSLSLLLSPEQSSHPPLHPPSKFRPRSPRKNHPKKNSPIKNGEQQQLSSVLVESEYVVKVALGHSCTHVVTSTGRWLVFGSNVNGLLALGGNITNAYRPVEVELPMAFGHEKVSSVSIGDTHGIALARSGRAFTWGTSSHDALGLGNKRFVPIPHPVHIPNPLRDTSLNLAITRHLVGESKTPTESHNNGLEAEEASSRMTDSNPVAYVHAGKDLSILILRSGSIHTCGVPSGRLSDDATPTEIFGGIQLWRRGS